MQTCRCVKRNWDCLVYLGFTLAIVKYTFACTALKLPEWGNICFMLVAVSCFMLYIVFTQVRGKAFLLFLVSVVLAVAVYLSNGHDDDLIIAAIAIYALRGSDISKLVKCYAAVMLLFFVLVTGYSIITGENIGIYEEFRAGKGYEYRYTFGFIHPNSLQGMYMRLVCGLILTDWGFDRRKIKYLLFEIGNIILFLFSDSRTGFIVLTVVLLFSFCSDFFIQKFNRQAFLYGVSAINFGAVLFTIFASVFYKKFEILDQISRLVTGRFDFANRFLSRFPISLFGCEINFVDQWGKILVLDCGIIHTLLHYGLIIFVVTFIIYRQGIRRIWEHHNYTGMIVVMGFTIYSVLENIYFNIFVNLGFVLCCYYIVNSAKRKIRYG